MEDSNPLVSNVEWFADIPDTELKQRIADFETRIGQGLTNVQPCWIYFLQDTLDKMKPTHLLYGALLLALQTGYLELCKREAFRREMES